jgi:3-deoxy-D-manno-octulosonate 8-phosphate phosphatase (KDO 8-P phosphatase)
MPVMDAALKQRASRIQMLVLDVDGVLTDGKLYFDHAGNEIKAFNTRDGMGIKALQRCGIEVAVITGRKSAAVTQRMTQLGVQHVYQGREDKLSTFLDLLEITGLDAHQVCFAGDDWIDIPVLLRVGLAVSVSDAESQVKDKAHWITSRKGGDGAVREICNLILEAQGKDQTIMDEILAL